ncbi:MAG TPA: asparagine synthase (glutamine-hydrolyzing) [Gammaproteobacteria bacterium]|nr:asparagine synthase (glutamine-hydrolyzing) [Gammaproteobacteria bacterium]
MCGLLGIWARGSSVDEEAALQTLTHRGPDDSGTFTDGGLTLAHTRLSILDLSAAGRQPMSSEDGRYTLIYNGEIYNHRELGESLRSSGCRFVSTSDTEVLLKGLELEGGKFLNRLCGMFSFALWDARQRELLLARDTTGVKPLLYYRGPDGAFAFASELKAFQALKCCRFELDHEMMRQYVEFGYVWDAQRTVIKNVHKLPPGHLLRVRDGHADAPRRWHPVASAPPEEGPGSMDQAADRLYETLSDVVNQQLVADVPVGLLLSGGLDSSVLAVLAARALDRPLRTLSVGFENHPGELEHARTVARFIGSDHSEQTISVDEVLAEFKRNARYYDDLFWDTGFITSLIIYRRCRAEGLKVVLVGEGADEIFAGYGTFARLSRGWINFLPPAMHRYMFYRQYSGQQWGQFRNEFEELIGAIGKRVDNDWFEVVRRYELDYRLPCNLNMKVDRASMANSIEARVPFQDPRVVALALGLPGRYLQQGSQSKRVLRHMALRHRLLPEKIVARPKFGMMMPGSWLKDDPRLFEFARQVVCSNPRLLADLGVERQIKAFFDGRERNALRHFRRHLALSTLVWRVFVLELWRRSYFGEPEKSCSGALRSRAA